MSQPVEGKSKIGCCEIKVYGPAYEQKRRMVDAAGCGALANTDGIGSPAHRALDDATRLLPRHGARLPDAEHRHQLHVLPYA